MSYAILRMQKIKNVGGLGKHIDRSFEGETSVPQNASNLDVSNNIHWDKLGNSYTQKEWTEFTKTNPLSNRINNEIKSRYKLDRKIRKDAVKAIEYIMTSDQFKMQEIFSDENLYNSWVKDNKEFLELTYGKENIISMHLHLDELTPHIHAVVVPITDDGRLSAKSFINGKKDLSKQQTLYSEMMKKYGMERGELGSTQKHQKPNSRNFKTNQNYERSTN